MLVLATAQLTNKTEPTGGVHKPIDKFNTMMIPKWSGVMPISIAAGRKIGVNMSTAGVISIKEPTRSNTKLMINKIMSGLSLTASKASATWVGILLNASNHDMATELATRNITIAVV